MPFIDFAPDHAPIGRFQGRTTLSLRTPWAGKFKGKTTISANVYFGAIKGTFRGKSTISGTLAIPRNLSGKFSGQTTIRGQIFNTHYDPYSLLIMLNLVPNLDSPVKLWQPHLTVDGEEVAVTSGNISSPSNQSGFMVTCRVTDVKDRTLIEEGESVDFGLALLAESIISSSITQLFKLCRSSGNNPNRTRSTSQD